MTLGGGCKLHLEAARDELLLCDLAVVVGVQAAEDPLRPVYGELLAHSLVQIQRPEHLQHLAQMDGFRSILFELCM